MVAHVLNPSTWRQMQRKADLCVFELNLVYRSCSRGEFQGDSVTKQMNLKNQINLMFLLQSYYVQNCLSMNFVVSLVSSFSSRTLLCSLADTLWSLIFTYLSFIPMCVLLPTFLALSRIYKVFGPYPTVTMMTELAYLLIYWLFSSCLPK